MTRTLTRSSSSRNPRRGRPPGNTRVRGPLLGAHVSIAGGVDLAMQRGSSLHCDAIQVFVKSNVRWAMQALAPGEEARFSCARAATGIWPVIAHSSYLINLASADPSTRRRSIRSLADELRRASRLGLPSLVLHPGSHGGRGVREGMRQVAAALDEVFAACEGSTSEILLETTAGQGHSLGGRFQELSGIIRRSCHPRRLGVCVDTCHIFAAGYDIRTPRGYRSVIRELDSVVGLHQVRAFHLNDCKGALGSHLDRHEHIGRGALGMGAFALLLNDPRFRSLPMILETPKGKGTALDRRNLTALKCLVKTAR